MEIFIPIIIIFFILSMISERIANLLKLNLPEVPQGRKAMGFIPGGPFRTKSGSKALEKIRERRIFWLSMISGIVVSFAAKANLIAMLRNMREANIILWWNDKIKADGTAINEPFVEILVGCLLSSIFISLGSKFWHDLLDIVLFTKNMKEKLSRPETFEVSSVDQLTEFLSFTESDMVRLAIAQNEQTLKTKFPNIEFLNDSIALVNGDRKDVLGIYVRDDNTTGMPDKVPVRLPSGKTFMVNTEIIGGIGVGRPTDGMDGAVARRGSFSSGSGCCIVHDEEHFFLLTNCHVFTGKLLQNPLNETGRPDVLYNKKEIGKWQFGTMTAAGDFALVELEDHKDFIKKSKAETFNNQTREITKDDWKKTRVTVRGNTSKTVQDAFVIDQVINKASIEYKEGEKIVFSEIILLGDKPGTNCQPVTDEGDSGGAVYDDDMRLIGIVTGMDNHFTYVIPVKKFIDDKNLQIV